MESRNFREELSTLESLLSESKSLPAEKRAGELVAAAQQIMGEEDPETGENVLPGLLNVPRAIDVLGNIREELAEVLSTPQNWDKKSEEMFELRRMTKRLEKASAPANTRIIRQYS